MPCRVIPRQSKSRFDKLIAVKKAFGIRGALKVLVYSVFSANMDTWLPKIGNLAIELHDRRCAEIVEPALSNYHFKRVTSGELTIFLDLRREPAVHTLGQPA